MLEQVQGTIFIDYRPVEQIKWPHTLVDVWHQGKCRRNIDEPVCPERAFSGKVIYRAFCCKRATRKCHEHVVNDVKDLAKNLNFQLGMLQMTWAGCWISRWLRNATWRTLLPIFAFWPLESVTTKRNLKKKKQKRFGKFCGCVFLHGGCCD